MRNFEIRNDTEFCTSKVGGAGTFVVSCGDRYFEVDEHCHEVLRALHRLGSCTSAQVVDALPLRFRSDAGRMETFLNTQVPRVFFEQSPPNYRPRNPFTVSKPLLNSEQTNRAARYGTWLFDYRFAILFSCIFIAYCFTLFTRHQTTVSAVSTSEAALIVLSLCIGSLIHEVGHATALRRFGVKAGEIGIALYVVFPVFFTNASAAWRLNRTQRAIVDLGGVYFQSIFASFLICAYLLTGMRWIEWCCFTILSSMVADLNPFLKMDGYWALADLTSMPNLHARAFAYARSAAVRDSKITREVSTRQQLFLMSYVLLGGIYLACFIAALFAAMIGVGKMDYALIIKAVTALSTSYAAGRGFLDAVSTFGKLAFDDAGNILFSVAILIFFTKYFREATGLSRRARERKSIRRAI